MTLRASGVLAGGFLLALASVCASAQGPTPIIGSTPTSVTVFVDVNASQSVSPTKRVPTVRPGARPGRTPVPGDVFGRSLRLFSENGGRRAITVRATSESAVAAALEPIEECNLLCLPGVSDETALRAAVEFCEDRGAMLVLDLPEECDTAAEAQQWLDAHSFLRHPNVAAYAPWVSMGPFATPPSGAVAAVYARTDRAHGVWKAPAGTEATIQGTAGPVVSVEGAASEALNDINVNALREIPGSGLAVWGGRTLSTEPEWRYVAVRRLALSIERSVSEGTGWVEFESNNGTLWATIRTSVETYMQELFRQGAFQGEAPRDAYFVKCDAETTTTADVVDGHCNVAIGFAPLRPAEFVVVRLKLDVGVGP